MFNGVSEMHSSSVDFEFIWIKSTPYLYESQRFSVCVYQMASALRSWTVPLALVLCVIVCLSSLAEAYPPKPEPPAGDLGPDEMAKYHTALRTLHQPHHTTEVRLELPVHYLCMIPCVRANCVSKSVLKGLIALMMTLINNTALHLEKNLQKKA